MEKRRGARRMNGWECMWIYVDLCIVCNVMYVDLCNICNVCNVCNAMYCTILFGSIFFCSALVCSFQFVFLSFSHFLYCLIIS